MSKAAGFREVPIRELMAEFHDGPHATPKPAASGPVFLGIKNITEDGRLDLSSIRHIDEADFPRWTRRVMPQADDIVFTYEATLHRYALIPEGFHGCLGRRLALIRPRRDIVDPTFLHLALRSPRWRKTVEGRLVSGATVDRIPLIEFPNFPILVPGIGVQRKVTKLVRAFDELIGIRGRQIGLIRNIVSRIYREWFAHLRFPGHLKHGHTHESLPRGWKQVRVGDVADFRYGKALPARSRRPGPYAVVSSAGVIGWHDRSLVRGPGIVIGRKGNVGSVWWVDEPFYPIDTTYYVETEMPLGLIFWQLRDLPFIDSHAAVPGLSREQASRLPLVRPPTGLARRFDEVHRVCFSAIATLRKQCHALASTRDLLLPRLVDGRLDVSDLDLRVLGLAQEVA